MEPQLAPRPNKANSAKQMPKLSMTTRSTNRQARTERTEVMRQLRVIEDLGYVLGIVYGQRMPSKNRHNSTESDKCNHRCVYQVTSDVHSTNLKIKI